MQAADQHAIQVQVFQVLECVRGGRVAVFDEDKICGDQTIAIWFRVPTDLELEGCAGLVDHYNARSSDINSPNLAMQVPQSEVWSNCG